MCDYFDHTVPSFSSSFTLLSITSFPPPHIFIFFSDACDRSAISADNTDILSSNCDTKMDNVKTFSIKRNIIIKSDIYRVGYSRELYGKEIYNYPIKRGGPSEIAIELKDGKKIFFDAYEYTSMQKLFFLKSITEKGNVLVEGKLNTMMSWKRYKHL